MTGPSRLRQVFLQLLCSFVEIVNNNIRFIIILWILSLITLGVVGYYGPEYIENQRTDGR